MALVGSKCVENAADNDEAAADKHGDLAAKALAQGVADKGKDDGGEEQRGGDDAERQSGGIIEISSLSEGEASRPVLFKP